MEAIRDSLVYGPEGNPKNRVFCGNRLFTIIWWVNPQPLETVQKEEEKREKKWCGKVTGLSVCVGGEGVVVN